MVKAKAILAALLASALIALIVGLGALRRLDRMAQDALFQHPGVTDGSIVIIGIDEETLYELGPYGPSYRQAVAMALEELASDPDQLPAAVAIDVLYEGESGTGADQRLADAAEKLGCVVTAAVAEFGREITWEDGRAQSINAAAIVNYVQPYEALRQVTTQGHINAMTDSDGVLRHALLRVRPDGETVYSMAAVTAGLYLTRHGSELTLPPTNAAGHYYVPFTGRPGAYSDGVSLYRLITGQVPAGYWADKIVLIGPYAAALQDAYTTPIDKGVQMYGVEYQANVIQSLIRRNWKLEIADAAQLCALFLICAAAAYLFLRMKVGRAGIVCAGCVAVSLAGAYILYLIGYVAHVLWIPAAVLIEYILAVAWQYVQAAREKRALALENERISTELSLAKRIQTNSLPKDFQAFADRGEFDIYASMTPAKEVGGDLYDFFMPDEDHLCLVIGDVSGKGFPAALFMMLAMALIHHVAMRETSPAAILTAVNDEICSRNPEEMFVTVWLGILELSTGKLTAANAGHEYPAMKKPDGHFELVKDRHGFVIGGMAGVRYREYTLQMEPGSRLLVYTDGVAEANNAQEELFGTDRMIEALKQAENGAPSEIIAALDGAIQAFVGKAPQFDDTTMLCLAYNGPAGQQPDALR